MNNLWLSSTGQAQWFFATIFITDISTGLGIGMATGMGVGAGTGIINALVLSWHCVAWHGMALYFTVLRYTKQQQTKPRCMALCCARDEAREVGWLVCWFVILGAYPIVSSCPNRRCFFIVYVLSSIETLTASLVFRLALIVGAHLTSL